MTIEMLQAREPFPAALKLESETLCRTRPFLVRNIGPIRL